MVFQRMAISRRYFIRSCSVKSPDEAIELNEVRREVDVTNIVQFEIKVPKVAEDYYKSCDYIYRYN